MIKAIIGLTQLVLQYHAFPRKAKVTIPFFIQYINGNTPLAEITTSGYRATSLLH